MNNWHVEQVVGAGSWDQQDFFQLVPPTPDMMSIQPGHSFHPLTFAPIPIQTTQPPPMAQQTEAVSIPTRPAGIDPRLVPPTLHPAPSFPTWRTHRSTSSVDSHASFLSNGWETTSVGGGNGSSDTSDSSREGTNTMDIGGLEFGNQYRQGLNGEKGLGLKSALRSHPPSTPRKASLSIDPNLFRPKSRLTTTLITTEPISVAGPPAPKEIEDGEDDDMATARPLGKKAKGKGQVSPRSKKSSHARKQNSDHIPRPRNAFILFRKHVVDSKLIPPSVEIRHQNVSVIVAKMWSEAPQEQKDKFNELAKVEKEEHMKKYPGYRYQPVYRRTNVIRRRVRKDEAEEEKCKSVAELLLKGKSGEALEEEIKEKLQQPLLQPGRNKSRRSGLANELSKGAIRALRAQARQQAASEGSDNSQSRSQSLASSRAGSEEADDDESFAREDSVASELAPKFDTLYPGLNGGMFQPLGMPYDSTEGQQQAWAPVQQTWAYPQADPNGTQQMGFAYQQPAVNAFLMYDQALPFSPSAQSFGNNFAYLPQDQLGMPPQYSMDQPFQVDIGGMDGVSAALAPGYTGGNEQTLPSWDMPFDENQFLGDFGAALVQAEGLSGW